MFGREFEVVFGTPQSFTRVNGGAEVTGQSAAPFAWPSRVAYKNFDIALDFGSSLFPRLKGGLGRRQV